MGNDDDLGDVAGYRLSELERRVDGLTQHAVSREWLEERLKRIDDSIAVVRADVAEIKQTEKSRRMAVYGALVAGVVSVVSALVLVALTLPQGASP